VVSGDIEGPLHLEQMGAGRPMVFLHANPMDNSSWLYQMAHFATWFRTVAIDLPGYGRSPRARDGVKLEDVARACWEAVDEITTEPAVLVGLSIGSSVALHMADQRPERTLALVLSGTGFQPKKEFAAERIRQYREQGLAFRRQHTLLDFGPTYRDGPLARYFADLFAERDCGVDVDTIIALLQAVSESEPERLFRVGAPSLIVTGKDDSAHLSAFALQARIEGCELVTIDDAGHACNIEKPWEWDRVVRNFLGRRGLCPA
jgi:pimeloyl-ACP methyl ester carboxylesterase